VRAVLLIAAKDLRQRFRDRSAIVMGFVAPLLIAALMSAAFGGAFEFHAEVALVDEDGGDVAAALDDVLADPSFEDLLTVERHDRAGALAAIDDGDLGAALVVPEGFTAAVVSGRTAELEVLAGVDTALAGEVTRSIAESFVGHLQANRIAVATALAAGAPVADLDGIVERATTTEPAVLLADDALGGRELDPISYYAPGMAIFFLFFAIGIASRSWFGEQREGTLDRIAAAPVRPAAIVAGKSLSVFAYGAASLATVALVTSTLFGARWGPPLAVAAIGLAMALAVVAVTVLVIAGSRTERQSEGLSTVTTFGLALLGGNFIFLASAPEAMRRAALLTPNGWALRGFSDLATGAPASAAVRPTLAILAFTAVVGGAAVVFARRGLLR
jgi:ABC-2 type transport system permease protein